VDTFLVLKALEDVERKTNDSTSTLHQQASPSKRKSVHVAEEEEEEEEDGDGEGDSDYNDDKNGGEGYNTRYKGVKRVKVHGFSQERMEPKPKRKVGRPRKSEGGDVVVVEGRKRGRPRTSGVGVGGGGGEQIKVSKGKGKSLENGDAAAAVVVGEVVSVSKRPRGRPRKVVPESNGVPEKKPLQSANSAPLSKDSAKEVFDGIVLVKRNTNRTEDAVGDDDNGGGGELANDERDGSEDAVIAAVNGDDAQGELSSLGGSNKGEI
jgi:AT hook motif